MTRKPVKSSGILKISLLLAILVSLPRNIHLYNMVSAGKMDFSGIWVADFFLRLGFLFLFSWMNLQLTANVAYTKINWKPGIRLIASIIINIGILFGIIELWKFFHSFIDETALTREDMGYMFFRYSILLLVLFFIAKILRLQTDQNESIVENERLKQQNLQNELSALKNQIDPHFLFNSLNSLISLVRDNEKATLFVKKLSYMYRYILQSSDSDLVSLKEELKFLESYTYLIQTRYRDRFQIDIHIEDKYLNEKIPPLALQILVENAVKHNEISETNPLKVEVYTKDGSLVVQNQIQPRTTLSENSGYGLQNLEKRYALLKKNKISIHKKNNIFMVELPLKQNT
ncbi:sensor histidine kinase [Maribacter arenosus]|uniref:Histidine kinase n=1 Tax=Maribacter arenosus TaxID=1854708 RepID=A0ABR7VIE2_9FLAO|nr:histidine kinase [Maribacter arenosus]MBD0852223.1 histidine kinase [Maribacter arenosus]